MRILVDTCVWSAVLRHKKPDTELARRLKDIINDGLVVIIGLIRQEILSGVPDAAQFEKLKENLAPFEDLPLKSEYFVKAAEFCNICRCKGLQGSAIDFLLCAVAHSENLLIFTTDRDFRNYQKYLPINLVDF
jgi:predicted nucleic acid-binding protein